MNSVNDIIHFVSLNCQGLGDKQKRQRLIQYLKEQKAHVVFLQETHFTEVNRHILVSEFAEWELFHSFGHSNSKGCTILISKTLNHKVIDTLDDHNGRYVLINIEIQNDIYSLLDIYSPNEKTLRSAFFTKLINIVL